MLSFAECLVARGDSLGYSLLWACILLSSCEKALGFRTAVTSAVEPSHCELTEY